MDYPALDPALHFRRLQSPVGKLRVVLDTDTYNEIDDQFAVTHALLSPERIDLQAIYAAPFHNRRSQGPGDGMEKSYEEILRLLQRLGRAQDGFVYRGSTRYADDAVAPERSAAALDLVERAMAGGDEPLYVAAVGAITNVAAALRIEPRIVQRIVVVWLGGQPLHWPTAREFNLEQDVPATRTVLDSGVPLVLIPCSSVASHLQTTVPEIESYVKGRGAIGDYLARIFAEYRTPHEASVAWSKPVWDLAAVAWLLNSDWVPADLVHSPILTDQVTWSRDAGRHWIRVAHTVHRDPVFRDLFTKLQRNATAVSP
jgi:purine nucleosidase